MEKISWSICANSARHSLVCGEDEQFKQTFWNFYIHFLTLRYIPPCLVPLWWSQLGSCIRTKLSFPCPPAALTASLVALALPAVKYYAELSCLALLLYTVRNELLATRVYP